MPAIMSAAEGLEFFHPVNPRRSMMKSSIAARVTIAYLMIASLSAVAFQSGLSFVLRRSLYSMTDDNLENQVQALRSCLRTLPADADFGAVRAELTQVYPESDDSQWIELLTETGDVIYRSQALASLGPLLPPDQVRHSIFRSRSVQGRPFRVVYQRFSVNGHEYVVELATPADRAIEILRKFRFYFYALAVPLLSLSTVMGHIVIRVLQGRANIE